MKMLMAPKRKKEHIEAGERKKNHPKREEKTKKKQQKQIYIQMKNMIYFVIFCDRRKIFAFYSPSHSCSFHLFSRLLFMIRTVDSTVFVWHIWDYCWAPCSPHINSPIFGSENKLFPILRIFHFFCSAHTFLRKRKKKTKKIPNQIELERKNISVLFSFLAKTEL